MAILKSLTFTAAPTRSHDPVATRRAKLAGRLEEQLLIFKNPSYVRAVQRWSGTGDERRRVEKQQQVRPWWRTDGSGAIVLSIYQGTRPVEFEKGKTGIVVPSKEKLPNVIETLIKAVREGELDDLLTRSSKPVGAAAKSRRAA